VGSARQREREGAQSGLRAREKQAGTGPKTGGRGREGGGQPRHGLDSTQIRGEREFLFSFLFSNSYIHFLFFSFDN
jgi:hypothetical protein